MSELYIKGRLFDDLLTRYPNHVPPTTGDLEPFRYTTLPERLAERRDRGKAYLDKEEVKALVEWKLLVYPLMQYTYKQSTRPS